MVSVLLGVRKTPFRNDLVPLDSSLGQELDMDNQDTNNK